MRRIVGTEILQVGLNNQRIAIAGLVALSHQNNFVAKIPEYLVEFTPKDGKLLSALDEIPIWEVFDRETFGKITDEHMTLTLEASESIGMWDCFRNGAAAITRCLSTAEEVRGDRAALSNIMHTIANRDLQSIADQISGWLDPQQTLALQLRIERDWQEHLLRKFGSINFRDERNHTTVDPNIIFAKLRATKEFSKISKVWACCDEADLTIEKDELKEVGRKFNFEILFKTDLPKEYALPNSRVKSSMIDFAICLNMQNYVGLNLSTFSNLLFIMNKKVGKKEVDHYVYNNLENFCKRRT
jgi:hypothetical protein